MKLVGLHGASEELSIDRAYAHSVADEAKNYVAACNQFQNFATDVDAAINESI